MTTEGLAVMVRQRSIAGRRRQFRHLAQHRSTLSASGTIARRVSIVGVTPGSIGSHRPPSSGCQIGVHFWWYGWVVLVLLSLVQYRTWLRPTRRVIVLQERRLVLRREDTAYAL